MQVIHHDSGGLAPLNTQTHPTQLCACPVLNRVLSQPRLDAGRHPAAAGGTLSVLGSPVHAPYMPVISLILPDGRYGPVQFTDRDTILRAQAPCQDLECTRAAGVLRLEPP